jgi:hypothetical protein
MGVIVTDDKDRHNRRSFGSDLAGAIMIAVSLLVWAVYIYSR